MQAESGFDPTSLPSGLPRPADDGAAAHLRGMTMPAIALPSTEGGTFRVDRVPAGFARLILYAYPKTGRPGVALPAGWDEIPGARGCTPESCGFRDHAAELARAGAAVAGVSAQDTDYQKEAAKRLRLPFALLSDSDGRLVEALKLPTFVVDGEALIKRLTLVIHCAQDGGAAIEHVFYPVFPPGEHAAEVLAWLSSAV
jgi:peroxiredoxin